jgi:hypothetical protein
MGLSSPAVAQRRNSLATAPEFPAVLSVDQQNALDLLKTLARDLKKEPDKLTAAKLQARIADELWLFDETFARESFRWSFEAAAQPFRDDLPKEKQPAYVTRQASAVKEVLKRFGAHDSKQAEAWFNSFQDEMSEKNPAVKSDSARLDLLMQIAQQLATSDPDRAARLATIALSGDRIPQGFGQVLFSLAINHRTLSNQLFRAALTTLQRSNYVYDPALISLTNYLFFANGEKHSNGSESDAQLLADFYVDAAWRQAGGDGAPLSPSSAGFYTQLELRAVPIVSRYAPERLPELRGQMTRLASGMNAEQAQRMEVWRATQQQQAAVSNRNNYSLDEQLERAEKEKNPQVRDALLTNVAYTLMRQDADRALAVAKKIDDPLLKTTAEDDIHLVKIQPLLQSRSYQEARKIALNFNNSVFRAKVLVALAGRAWSNGKDAAQAAEILSEAIAAAAKAEDSPDKVLALLSAVEQFALFDSIRAFETLGTAIATFNRLKADAETSRSSAASKPLPLLRIKTFTVINGKEMTSENDATIESIDFHEIKSLAVQDYMQARLLANKIDQPVQRANYLTALATSVLKSERLKTSKN